MPQKKKSPRAKKTKLTQSREAHVEKNKLAAEKQQTQHTTGILRMHAKGFGFVIPDNPTEFPQDIFIRKHLTDSAVDGDHVEVALNLESVSEKGPEGRIVAVLKRARKHLAGTIRQVNANGDIMAYVPILGASRPVIVLSKAESALKIGDRVILN